MQISKSREIIGFILAPIIPIIICTLSIVTLFEWKGVIGNFFMVSAFAYPMALFIGFPMYIIMKRFQWLSWYKVAIGGFLSVWFPWTLPSIVSNNSFNVLNINGHQIIQNGSFTKYGRLWFTLYQSEPALLGSLGGIIFWFIVVRSSPRRAQ